MAGVLTSRFESFRAATGWRKTAGILAGVMVAIEAALVLVLIVASARSGGAGVRGNYILYRGSCSQASATNLVAHLLINVLATGVLASSNFFMQILNAPTRREIDRIHNGGGGIRGAGGTWVDIGTPSFRNLRFMAWWKIVAWLLLALSSAPLHLFFNSAVFLSDDLRYKYNITMAAESFVGGSPWFSPGASLRLTSSLGPRDDYNTTDLQADILSPPEIPTRIARKAGGWKRLSPSECRSAYIYSRGLRAYGDVVIVIESPDPGGWRREDVFSGNATFDRIWDTVGVPSNATNSMWHYEGCAVSPQCGTTDKSQWTGLSCYHIFGLTEACIRPDDDSGSLSLEWKFPFFEQEWIPEWEAVGFQTATFNTVKVKFCMAEPTQDDCKVAMSNTLLALSLLAVSVKLAVAFCVYVFLLEPPLVTPGDAVASFICHPDASTRGMCTFGRLDFEKRTRTRWWLLPFTIWGGGPVMPLPRHVPLPRRWTSAKTAGRWIMAVPLTSLLLAYLPSIALLAALIHFFRMGYATNNGMQEAGFGRSSSSFVGNLGKMSILELTLYANVPQLALSICYLQFNAVMTRMLAAREWALFSSNSTTTTQHKNSLFRGLRVTAPAPGSAQVSTWRLQLPYRYALPLMASSTLLHWLVSNCVYVLVAEGGYVKTYGGTKSQGAIEAGLSEQAVITIGYSLQAMVATIVLGFVFICVPLGLGIRRLPGEMPVVGSNSMAISAACHVVVAPDTGGHSGTVGPYNRNNNNDSGSSSIFTAREEDEAAEVEHMEMRNLLKEVREHHGEFEPAGVESSDASSSLFVMGREAMARGLLGWGVVDVGGNDVADMDPVGHLSFGSPGQVMGWPVPGRLYA